MADEIEWLNEGMLVRCPLCGMCKTPDKASKEVHEAFHRYLKGGI